MADKGYIDLGKKYDMGEIAKDVNPKDHIDYPTLYISHDTKDSSGLDELPDGEFEFTARGRVIKYTEDLKNGKCNCEIEVLSIKPEGRKVKKAKSVEENLDAAFDKVVEKKKK